MQVHRYKEACISFTQPWTIREWLWRHACIQVSHEALIFAPVYNTPICICFGICPSVSLSTRMLQGTSLKQFGQLWWNFVWSRRATSRSIKQTANLIRPKSFLIRKGQNRFLSKKAKIVLIQKVQNRFYPKRPKSFLSKKAKMTTILKIYFRFLLNHLVTSDELVLGMLVTGK